MMVHMDSPQTPSARDACDLAPKARDARFDGCFPTGVTSTGIHCRPVCRVRTPKQENCRFFYLAAQAERAGYRPCLRCRPELAPRRALGHTAGKPRSMQDASAFLAGQAAAMMDAPPGPTVPVLTVQQVALRPGISDRHAVMAGQLCLDAGVDASTTLARLQTLPGIGDWTAHCMALRALRWPDAFLAGDVALHRALRLLGTAQPTKAAQAACVA